MTIGGMGVHREQSTQAMLLRAKNPHTPSLNNLFSQRRCDFALEGCRYSMYADEHHPATDPNLLTRIIVI